MVNVREVSPGHPDKNDEKISKYERALLNNIDKVNSFQHLNLGWNGYEADPIDKSIIDDVKSQLYLLSIQPDVFPTARNSVQLEFHHDNGNYLEFEIFRDKVVKLCETNNKEIEQEIKLEEINKMVDEFYG